MGAFDDLPTVRKPAARPMAAKPRNGGAFDDLPTVHGQPSSAPEKPYRATDGMSAIDRARAGIGVSLVDSWNGLKQAATEGMSRNAAVAGGLLHTAGLDAAGRAVDQYAGAPLMRSAVAQRQAKTERDAMHADLRSTTAGKVGEIGGTLAQLVGPGLAARGGTAAAMLLPRTVGGGVAQGAALGYLQPADNEIDRLRNAGTSAAFGLVGAGAPKLVGKSIRGARTLSERLTQSGAQRRAVREVMGEASNPAALMQAAPSGVPGSRLSLFAETQDPGVARMETRSRGNASGWVEQDKVNNAARVAAVRSVAGDEASLRAAEAARSSATAPMYAKARAAGAPVGKDVAASKLAQLVTRTKGRAGVEETLSKLQADVQNAGSVNELMNIRDTMTDMLAGKYAGDTNKALVGSRVLMEAKAQLERTIGSAAPSFRPAQRTFRDMSAPINRMEAGQRLLMDSTGNVMDDLGHYTLSADKFGRGMKNLDGVAQAATGFRKAQAANIFGPQDMATLGAVNNDLSREAMRLRYGSGGNSHTASQQELAARMAGGLAGRFMPAVVGDVMKSLEKAGQGRLNDAVAYVLQNPSEYRRIAATLPNNDRLAFEQAMSQIGRVTGLSLSTLTNQSGVPAGGQ